MIKLRDRFTEADRRNETLLIRIGVLEGRLSAKKSISTAPDSSLQSESQSAPGSKRSSYVPDNPFGSTGRIKTLVIIIIFHYIFRFRYLFEPL